MGPLIAFAVPLAVGTVAGVVVWQIVASEFRAPRHERMRSCECCGSTVLDDWRLCPACGSVFSELGSGCTRSSRLATGRDS
jgi:hypothetical protein